MTPPSRATVLHVIQRLSEGGAGRALLLAARRTAGDALAHQVASLVPASPGARAMAKRAGLALLDASDDETLRAAVADADIVHVHFWGAPELDAWLRAPWPEARVLVWCHVAGEHPPHVVTRELLALADRFLATSAATLELPAVREATTPCGLLVPVADFSRLDGRGPTRREGFTVGYIGTVDFAKMHRDYVAMSAAVAVPGARFVVCGRGAALPALAAEVRRLGVADRFELRGHVEDVGGVLGELDVFGYPLCPDTYATAEMVLQEAMYAGVPPVILAHGGAQRLVAHERTGLVARDGDEYARAIERLHADPALRARLGEGAREHARRTWDAARMAAQLAAVYARMLEAPKRPRAWPGAATASGAARFVAALGNAAPEFGASLAGAGAPARDEPALLEAERAIAEASPVLASADGGGVLHYRRAYPRDPHLRLWSGLILHRQGRPALAAGELSQAVKLGLDHPRVRGYLARAIAVAGGEAGDAVSADPTTAAEQRAGEIALSEWVRPRDGLGDLQTRLREHDCRIAYLGASVTAQKEGFRSLLHADLVRAYGRAHAPVVAATGGVGSVSGVFTMDRLVTRHRPDLCVIEYTTGDAEPANTPPGAVGPALEGMIRQLGAVECRACVVHLYRRDQTFDPPDPLLLEYERVAEHYGVPTIDAGRWIEAAMRAGRLDAGDLFRDVVHTTPAGSRLTADLIARGLGVILDTSASPPLPPAARPFLHARRFDRTRVVPVAPEMLGGPHTRGRHRFFYEYVQVGPETPITCRLDGELVGIMVVVGPDAGIVEIAGPDGVRERSLWDPTCFYERYHTAIFDPPYPPGATVSIRLTDKPIDYARCRRPVEHPERIAKTLRIIGFMVRG